MKLPGLRSTRSFALLAALLSLVTFSLSPRSLAAESSSQTTDIYAQAKQSIVLLYPAGTDPCANAADSLKFIGTGFLMTLSIPGSAKRSDPFLITNRHVVDKQSSIVMRVSLSKDCACQTLQLRTDGAEPTVLAPKKPGVNLVAIRTVPLLDTKPLAVAYDALLDSQSLRSLQVTEGHDIFAPDLFMPGAGSTDNLPLIRSGKIAMLRDDDWMHSDYGVSQAYFGELTTTFGATGMPVIILPEKRILGVVRAITFAPVPVSVNVGETKLEDGIAVPKTVAAKGTATVPNDMVVIEPAENLKELLAPIAQELRK